MDQPALPLVLYVIAKFIGYVTWCFLGLRWAGFKDSTGGWILRSVGLGSARLAIGWGAGIGVGLAAVFLFHSFVAAYFFILVPVRWLEWSALAPSIFKNDDTTDEIRAMRVPGLSRRWRLGGIVLSCAIDLPFVIHGGGFPSGRIFC